jgi:membrane fusion protein
MIAAAIVLFLIFGHYTRRETVSGQLVPSAGLLNIVAPRAGIIGKLSVYDGQTVKSGDVLIEIYSDQDSVTLGDTRTLIGRQLDAQRTRLQADLINQQQLLQQQTDALRKKIALLQIQLRQVISQLGIEQEQVTNSQQLLNRIRPLGAEGFVSEVQIQQQRAEVLGAQSQYKTLQRQQLDIRQKLNAANLQLTQLPLEFATSRNDTERQLAGVVQSIAQNELQRAVVLRAPRDGVISTVLPKVGQAVSAGQSLLSILPAGSTLQAQLLVPSRAIGFIDLGSRVVLRYEAFPYQKFGQQYGRVIDVSRSALTPSEITVLTGLRSQSPVYRVQVKLDKQFVLTYGKREAVKPGMALQADILMDRRSLLEWVFEPLYGMAHHLTGMSHG